MTTKLVICQCKLVKKQRGNQRFCVNELHVDGKVYNDFGEGVLQGWFQHFKSLAEPSVNADFDEKYKKQVDAEVNEIIDMCCSLQRGGSRDSKLRTPLHP